MRFGLRMSFGWSLLLGLASGCGGAGGVVVPFTSVSAGTASWCGLTESIVPDNASIECWGLDQYAGVFGAVSASKVALGYKSGCALLGDASVICWGGDTSTPVFGTGPYTDVSVNRGAACAIDEAGSFVYVSEYDDDTAVPPEGTFEQVSCGAAHGAALDATGAISQYDDLKLFPDAPTTAFASLEAGYWDQCGVTLDGGVECWGRSESDVPDDSEAETWPTAWEVPEMTGFTDVATGFAQACGLDTSGGVTCWGSDDAAALDAPTGSFTDITGGSDFACGVNTDGAVQCWGGYEMTCTLYEEDGLVCE